VSANCRPRRRPRRLLGTLALLVVVDASVAAQGRGDVGGPMTSTTLALPRELRADAARLQRLERWVVAVGRHVPGQVDPESRDLAVWGLTDLQGLWIDINSLAQTMRNRGVRDFALAGEDGRLTRIVYPAEQLRDLRRLACVAGGYLDPSGHTEPAGSIARDCLDTTPVGDLPSALRDVAVRFGRARVTRGDDNLALRRAAVLHADIAMLHNPVGAAVSTPTLPIGPRRTRLELVDGRATGMTLSGIHWEIAEAALRFIQPPGAKRPAPGGDAMVRDWYRATGAWLQAHEQHDSQHMAEAVRLFADDPVLLFLSGCQHEAYASPVIQIALDAVPRDVRAPRAGSAEWRQAESLFRQALKAAPDMAEARLHLGRVLTELGRPADGAAELRTALAALDEPVQKYYAALFLGAAEEHAGNFAAARDAFRQARDLVPAAQTPLLALSQLARRRDDAAAAREAMAALFALPAPDDTADPWWTYQTTQGRDAVSLVLRVWATVEWP
jgi:hypothetical protein